MMRLMLSLSMCFLLLACAKKSPHHDVAVTCGAGDTSLAAGAEVRHDHMRLSRVNANYRVTACDGSVSTTTESVKDPKDAYSLSLKNADQYIGQDIVVSAFDRTTCSTGEIKPRKNSDTRMEIQMHTSPGTHRMHVEKNVDNYIDYEFRLCTQRDAGGRCVASNSLEKGTLILFIDYTEETESNVRERKLNCPNK